MSFYVGTTDKIWLTWKTQFHYLTKSIFDALSDQQEVDRMIEEEKQGFFDGHTSTDTDINIENKIKENTEACSYDI